eukprot:3650876-Alexandrium_andersonii.AAC.1
MHAGATGSDRGLHGCTRMSATGNCNLEPSAGARARPNLARRLRVLVHRGGGHSSCTELA